MSASEKDLFERVVDRVLAYRPKSKRKKRKLKTAKKKKKPEA